MKQILIVEDSGPIRNILKSALSKDFTVHEAEHGKDGLDKARTLPVDLFLLDLNMPVMDGITCCEQLRKMPRYEKTPILMLTTETKDEKREAGKKAGATGWIVKPFDPDKLLATIKKLI